MALYRLSNIRLNSVRLSREGSSILPPIIFHSRYLQYKYSINTSKNEKSIFLFEPGVTHKQSNNIYRDNYTYCYRITYVFPIYFLFQPIPSNFQLYWRFCNLVNLVIFSQLYMSIFESHFSTRVREFKTVRRHTFPRIFRKHSHNNRDCS